VSSVGSCVTDDGPGLDRQRLTWTWRVVGAGAAIGVIGAAAIAAIGGSGTAGLAVVLLGAAVGCVVGGLVTGIVAIVDEVRGRVVGRRRLVTAIGLFVAGVVLLILSSGLA
jgi:hypothetical protein